MSEDNIKELQNIAKTIKRINGKIKLLALLERAKFEYDSNNFSDCEKTCKEILKTNPKNATALRGLGCVAQIKGDLENAKKYYQKALEFSENKEIEYTFIGTIYYLQENLEKALEFYNKAIDANDNYTDAYEGKNQTMLENHLKLLDLQDSLIRQKLF